MELTGNLAIAVALCVVSAVAYAGAALLQERVAEQPLRRLLRSGPWWLALACNGLAAGLHVLALRYGPPLLVQALGVLTLLFAVPLTAFVQRRPADRTQSAAAVMTALGLGVLLTLIGTSAATALSGGRLATLLVVTAAALAVLGWCGRRPSASGLWSAAAGGTAFGVASALTQTVTVHLADAGLGALARPTPLAALLGIVALNVAGLWLTQLSYRRGLAGPLAMSNLANPLAAAAIGVVLLGERFRLDGLGLTLLLLCSAGVAAGVWLLSTSASAPADEARHPELVPVP